MVSSLDHSHIEHVLCLSFLHASQIFQWDHFLFAKSIVFKSIVCVCVCVSGGGKLLSFVYVLLKKKKNLIEECQRQVCN